MGGLLTLAARDAETHNVLVQVNQLVRPATALRDPTIAARLSELLAGG